MEKRNYSSYRASSPTHALKTLSISFSEEEVLQALRTSGYAVEEIWKTEERHVHGSRFTPEHVRLLLATKNGITEPALTAFSKLIKQRLLQA